MTVELAEKRENDPSDKQIVLSFLESAHRKEGGELVTYTGLKFTLPQLANVLFLTKPDVRHGVIDHFTKLIEAHAKLMPYIKYLAVVLLTPKS